MSTGQPPKAFVAVLVIHLHFPDAGSLKAKRRELAPVKAHLQGKLGAALAEVEHQDLWQRATLVAAHRRGLTGRRAEIVLDGGTLLIEWREDGHVFMTGPAAVSFSGLLDPSLLEGA